jgi:uncharacterized protein involved in type VI secretion and phage assembly
MHKRWHLSTQPHSHHTLVTVDAGYNWPACPQQNICLHRLAAAKADDSIHRNLVAHSARENNVANNAYSNAKSLSLN